ncbi:hypothetical protein Tco_0228405 [Tanacetum coccineum]
MTHPHPNRRFVPKAVLTRSAKINTTGTSVNTAGVSVNTTVRPVEHTARATISKEYKEKGVINSEKELRREIADVSGEWTPVRQNGVAERRNITDRATRNNV